MAKSANSGPLSAEEQNTIRREVKARRAKARSSAPRSSGNLFRDYKSDRSIQTRRQNLQHFLARGRKQRSEASKTILESGFGKLDGSALEAAIWTIKLYAETDPHVSQRGDRDMYVIASSFKIAAFSVREGMSGSDPQAIRQGIDAAGRALEAYRNNGQKAR